MKKNSYLCFNFISHNMEESAKRILFVNSEIFPYLPESSEANIGRYLPQGIQERKREIRSFMPRYGCINERKNQLHEVIRLSGMNIIINDVDRPLIIKVASISAARIQVYFIDNEDYFKRKQVYRSEKGKFFEDNAERAIFFARGVLETVKKLRWVPDIIHCHGWMSHLLPMYLKKAYIDDPIFSESKIVVSLYEDTPKENFSPNFNKLIAFGNASETEVPFLADPSGTNLAKTAVQYADGVILASDNIDNDVIAYSRERALPMLEYNKTAIENGSYIDIYNEFYDQL